MERCPNCGAPARPGAKFCTTCGYRLPVAVPINQPADTNDTAATSAASSWPPPPAPLADAPASDQPQAEVAAEVPDEVAGQEQIIATETQSASDEVVVVPVTVAGSDATDGSEVAAAAESADTASSTDSVVSYSWPSPATASKTSPWSGSDTSATSEETVVSASTSTTVDEVVEAAGEDVIAAGEAVTEETVVVAEPASQYEGWSAAVVEDLAAPTASHGTNVARATALLDELRLLLPILNSGSGSEEHDLIAGELAAALATSPETSGDRQALRAALNDARDNPRDIQTILGLAQQADAAIALLDDHDRLISAVRQAIASLRPTAPGLDPEQN